MRYQFAYTLNEKDYLEFNKYHLTNGPVAKKAMLFQRLFVPFLFALMLIAFGLASGGDWQPVLITGCVFLLISVAWWFAAKHFFAAINTPFLKLNIWIMKKSGKLPFSKDVTISFYGDYFVQVTETAEIKTKYAAIERVAEGKTAVYVYIGAIQAFIIPLEAFESESQKAGFLAFVREMAEKD
jgi:hypothetical protein